MKWTEDQVKELKEKYSYYIDHRKEAEISLKRNWSAINIKALHLEIKLENYSFPKIKNKKCPMFLGCHVAERVLSHVFKEVKRMPFNNPGFDFICNKGFKIDVKSACLYNNKSYTYILHNNKIADYFLCIGFDNRKDLNPQHIWLIKSDEIINNRKLNEHYHIYIKNNNENLLLYSKYELTDKLKETIDCCTELKSNHKPKVKLVRLRRKIK